jgi:ArsR family transcriptional regulator, arsenate/arsenite/antimonite-responsive transcriptional repressor / arsenate reductase (thioredoxin)
MYRRGMAAPPRFLQLAGHPLRWVLLSELAHSDLRVGELCSRTGRPQSLVSYHLRQLRDGGVVTSRRSAADGRDAYYVLDLGRCRELLAGAGAELHPALARAAPPAATAGASVLFLCTGNSSRSQMAEAMWPGAVSAGSHPKPLHPYAVQVMRERGIDISGRRSKHMSEFAGRRFDHVVTLCDRVREVCPEFPGAIHWSIPDPAREGTLDAFERTAAELETRIGFFMQATRQEVTHA